MRDYPQAREQMVQQELVARGVTDPRVLEAIRRVPRHRFVAEPMARDAYGSSALPIGSGQTISAPHMVGLMTQALELTGKEKVLEIGTGSGYQAAILGALTTRVITVERIADLARRAQGLLAELGMHGVIVKVGDGTLGLPEMAPFDRIIVTAGAPSLPRPLLDQLGEGGILVIPEGPREGQDLKRYRREGDRITEEVLCHCLFVPLVGKEGFPNPLP